MAKNKIILLLTLIKLSDIIISIRLKLLLLPHMLYPRETLNKIKRVISREEFIILTGARQTGKTSLLILLKEFLEEAGNTCYYLNLENPEYLNFLNKHPFNIFELIPKSKKKQFVCLDEIQYLANPTNFLKLLFDEKRSEIKVIASGSSAFYIDKKFKDSLVGRKFLFEVYPLNFDEYLFFNEQIDLLNQKGKKLSIYYKSNLLALWNEYLTFGGYPKVVLEKEKSIKRIIIEELASSYIRKDVTDAGIRNSDKYFFLLKILADQTGKLVNIQELSNTLNLSHLSIEEYLYVMAKSYQIAFIKPFHKNIRKELTKMPKAYFYDLGLRNFFLGNFDMPDKRMDKGSFLENVVFRELNFNNGVEKIKFWRTQDQKEVDFIVNNEAYEIKFDQKRKTEKKYRQFKKEYSEIKLNFISNNEILKKFYGWKI